MTTLTPEMGVAVGVSAWTTPETVIKSTARAGVELPNVKTGQINKKTIARMSLSTFRVFIVLIRTLDNNYLVVSLTSSFGHLGGQ